MPWMRIRGEGGVLSVPRQCRGRREREVNNRFHQEADPAADLCVHEAYRCWTEMVSSYPASIISLPSLVL